MYSVKNHKPWSFFGLTCRNLWVCIFGPKNSWLTHAAKHLQIFCFVIAVLHMLHGEIQWLIISHRHNIVFVVLWQYNLCALLIAKYFYYHHCFQFLFNDLGRFPKAGSVGWNKMNSLEYKLVHGRLVRGHDNVYHVTMEHTCVYTASADTSITNAKLF